MCICVCVYVCVYIYIYIYMYAHTCMYVYICVYVCIYVSGRAMGVFCGLEIWSKFTTFINVCTMQNIVLHRKLSGVRSTTACMCIY